MRCVMLSASEASTGAERSMSKQLRSLVATDVTLDPEDRRTLWQSTGCYWNGRCIDVERSSVTSITTSLFCQKLREPVLRTNQ